MSAIFSEKYEKVSYDGSRIIVISDIHGGLKLFNQLLMNVEYSQDDYLIILGDFIQRGYQNIDTLNRIMTLSKHEKVIVVSGNHEHYLHSILERRYIDRFTYHLEHINYGCILREWINSEMHKLDMEKLQDILKVENHNALEFLRNLPYAVELNNHLFVHGGLNADYMESDTWELLSSSEFLLKKHNYPKMVVVGHWPVQNYKQNSLSGYPIFDFEHRIISIDGGYGVKSSGQLNALIIASDYQVASIDSLEKKRLKVTIEKSSDSIVKLDYLDKKFKLLEKGEAFSLVEKSSTGQIFKMKNEFLNFNFEDYISTMISGQENTEVGIIQTYGKYYLVKCSNEIGWVKKDDVMD